MLRQRLLKHLRWALWFLLVFVCLNGKVLGADVSLAWDASVSPNIAGYKVYVGQSSRTYGTPVTIGNQTTHTVTGLPSGTYYFAVTAFNTSGNESGFSNEVSTTIAGTIPGDLNSDGKVNTLDLQVLVNAILGVASNPKADVNGDGNINVLDLQGIIVIILSNP
jgi:hypothetical protein